MNKKSKAHEMIKKLRKDFDIPEEKTDPYIDELERKYQLARDKRAEVAETEENYRKLFHRDYWTDEWIGEGPEEPPQYLDEFCSKKEMFDIAKLYKKSWKSKYAFSVPVYHLPAEPKESKAVKKARKKRKTFEEQQAWQKKVDLAYWWLEEYLKPSFAQEIYLKFSDDYEGLVEYCSEIADSWIKYLNRETLTEKEFQKRFRAKMDAQERITPVEDDGYLKWYDVDEYYAHKRKYYVDLDENPMPEIPDEYWDEFESWTKHLSKEEKEKYKKKAKKLRKKGTSVTTNGVKRAAFLKVINKRNKDFHINVAMTDQLRAGKYLSNKDIEKYANKAMSHYEKRRGEFEVMLAKFVHEGTMTEDFASDVRDEVDQAESILREHYRELKRSLRDNSKADAYYEKRRKHDNKVQKGWDKWVKDIGDELYKKSDTRVIDGEEFTLIRKHKLGAKQKCYEMRGKTSSMYVESLDAFKYYDSMAHASCEVVPEKDDDTIQHPNPDIIYPFDDPDIFNWNEAERYPWVKRIYDEVDREEERIYESVQDLFADESEDDDFTWDDDFL